MLSPTRAFRRRMRSPRRPKGSNPSAAFNENGAHACALLTLRCPQAPAHALVIGRGLLIRDPVDRAFVSARGRAGHRLDHFARAFRIGDPLLIEIVGADRDAARAFAGIDHAGIAAMDQLVEVVLRLAGASGIADQALRQLGILDAVFLLAGLAEGAAVEADDR